MPRDQPSVKRSGPRPAEQARTRLARRAVVAAAAEVFAERGYGAATIEAVSERAGVSVASTYRLFGSKVGILKAWLDTSIGGDDSEVAVADRPAIADLDPDPWQLITGFAAVAAGINARSHTVYAILAGAALSDPGAATLFDQIQRQRFLGQRGLTRRLAALAALREGLSERHAADIVHAIMSPETYRLLVVERRWSARRYRDWVTSTLRQQLLAGGPA